MNSDSLHDRVGAPMRLRLILGLLSMLAALFALTGTALAATGFVAEKYPATLSGTSIEEGVLYLPENGYYTCSESSLSGTLSAASKTISTTPSWPKLCTAPQESVSSWSASGCKLEVTAISSSKATAAIGPAGCGPIKVTATAGFCSFTIPPQSGLAATLYSAGGSIRIEVYSSIKYTPTGHGCRGISEGTYKAAWELTGKNGGSDPLSLTESFEVAPTVTRGLPSGVNASEATLHATVNPNYLSTTYQFEYGTTPEFGSKAPASPASIGSGSSPVAVSQTLTGLSPNTVYYYRVSATNSQGTVGTWNRTFKTTAGGKPAEIKWPSGTTEVTVTGSGAAQTLASPSFGITFMSCQEVSGQVGDVSGTGASGFPLSAPSFHNKGSEKCSGALETEPKIKFGTECKLEFNIGELTGTNEATGSVSLNKCLSSNEAITISGGALCTIRVTDQQNVSPATFKAVGGEVEVKLSMTGIAWITTGLCGAKSGSDGVYSGTMLLKGNKGSVTIE